MGKQNNRPIQPNWFAKQEQRLGKDFLQSLNGDDINRSIGEIFRDIARQRYDIYKDGRYFLDYQFLERCIVAAQSKVSYYTILANSMRIAISSIGTSDPYTLQVYNSVTTAQFVYTVIINNLMMIQQTGNLSYLTVIASQIRQFKNALWEDRAIIPEMDVNYKPYNKSSNGFNGNNQERRFNNNKDNRQFNNNNRERRYNNNGQNSSNFSKK